MLFKLGRLELSLIHREKVERRFFCRFYTTFRFGDVLSELHHESGPFASLEDAKEHANKQSAWLCRELDDIVVAHVVDEGGKERARIQSEFVRVTREI
jgi:hypothetical protein